MTLYNHFLLFLISINLSFSNSIQDRYNAVATRIIKNAQADSTAYKRLEYLCDTYGPRLSGSKNLERSIEWILKKMELDPCTIAFAIHLLTTCCKDQQIG